MTAVGHPTTHPYRGWTAPTWRDLVLVATDPQGRQWSIGEITPHGADRGCTTEVLRPDGSRWRARDHRNESDARRWAVTLLQRNGCTVDVPPQWMRAADVVARHHEGIAPRAVAVEMGVTIDAARQALRGAIVLGRVRREGCTRDMRYYPVPGGTPAVGPEAEPMIRLPDVSESASPPQGGPAVPVACPGCGTAGRLFAHPWGTECLSCGRCTPSAASSGEPTGGGPPGLSPFPPVPSPDGPTSPLASVADGPGCPGLPTAAAGGSAPAVSAVVAESGPPSDGECDHPAEWTRQGADGVERCVCGHERRWWGEQPAPTGGSGDCWAELIGLVVAEHPELSHLVPAMVARRRLGLERYGVPLGRGDGRDGLRDLVEELADGAAYAVRDGRPDLAVRLVREWAGVVR